MKIQANTICLSVCLGLATAGMVTTFTGCAGDRYTRSTGEYIDDKSIDARVKEALSSNGLTSSEMADIFKQKFRSSGLLKQGNIPRDLVSKAEYFGSVDDHWFLKQSGKSEAAKLVTEAKGSKASTASA